MPCAAAMLPSSGDALDLPQRQHCPPSAFILLHSSPPILLNSIPRNTSRGRSCPFPISRLAPSRSCSCWILPPSALLRVCPVLSSMNTMLPYSNGLTGTTCSSSAGRWPPSPRSIADQPEERERQRDGFSLGIFRSFSQ